MLITTPRLLLKPPTLNDVPAIQSAKEEIWDDLRRWMSWSSPDNLPADRMIDYILKAEKEKNLERVSAFTKDTLDFAVLTGCHPTAENDVYSTGYWAARAQQGKGFATEATNAMIRYAFGVLNAKKVKITYYEGNQNSKRVIEKLGFTFDKTVKGGHISHFDGKPMDVHHFYMTSTKPLPDLVWDYQ